MKPETVFNYLFILLLPSVLISFAANSIIFVLLSVIVAFSQLTLGYSNAFFKKYGWFSTFIISIFIAFLLDIINQHGFNTRLLTKRLAFVLLPFIVFYSKKSHQTLALKMLVYSMSILSSLFIVIGLIRSWLNKGEIVYGNWDSETTEAFYANDMLLNWGELSYKRIFLFLDIHPTYYAFFSAVVILIILFTPFIKLGKWQKWALVFLHSLMILLISSKAGIISLLLIMGIEFFKAKNPKQMILGLSVLSLITIIALSIPSTQLRIKRAYQSVVLKDTSVKKSSSVGRLQLWNSLNDFSTTELITGLGIKTSRAKVKEFTGQDKNMHNQFLQALVSSGIIGLILLICFLAMPSFYHKNIFIYSFIALLVVNLFLENMLDRVSGIMMVAFFYSLFIFGDESLFNKEP